jgi:hypothetical protein
MVPPIRPTLVVCGATTPEGGDGSGSADVDRFLPSPGRHQADGADSDSDSELLEA